MILVDGLITYNAELTRGLPSRCIRGARWAETRMGAAEATRERCPLRPDPAAPCNRPAARRR